MFRTFALKIINNEEKKLTHHEISVSPCFSFTYSFKLVYKCFVRLTFRNIYERYYLIFVRSSFRGCLHVKFYPGMKVVPEWNHPFLWWNVSSCLHVFAEAKFHTGMSSSLSKRKTRIHLGMKKKTKRRVNTSFRDETFKRACFFLIFDVYIQICFPKLTCLNVMKV